MYSRPARGKVPEYPRHVPTLDVEDIPICKDTVVYEHWTDDATREAEEGAKKRQKRRQEAAENYLRGGEIRILTASLKGPFEGWKNPWAKKRQRREVKTEAEVPETTVRNTRPALPQAGRRYLERGSQRDPLDLEADDDALVEPWTSRNEPPDPFNAKDRTGPLPLAGPAPSSTKRVEDWLKASDVYARRPRSPAGSSPTPAARPPTRERVSPGPRSSPTRTKPREQEKVVEQEAHFVDVRKETAASQPATSSPTPTHESPQRAEAAILEQKRKSLHVIPPSTNLPAFEYRRPRRAGKKDPAKQQSSNPPAPEGLQNTKLTNQAPPVLSEAGPLPPPDQPKTTDRSALVPALSTEISKTSTVHNLPSAQVAPALNHAQPVSNNHSTNDLLQELHSATRSVLQTRKATELEVDAASVPDKVQVERSQWKGEEDPHGKDITATEAVVTDPPGSETPVRELETQEMIAAIKPFDFSTIKKPTSGFRGLQSPVTATKARSANPSKRASFAGEHPLSDDSQKSIKAGMKVKKATTTAPSEKCPPKVPLFEETTTSAGPVREDVDYGFLDESLPSISSMFGPKKANAPKSILKSSNAISSAPVRSGNATSTSMRQEAQIPSGQPRQQVVESEMVDEDDSFDLNAAIDDLGSYLGTWDADEEATKLVA